MAFNWKDQIHKSVRKQKKRISLLKNQGVSTNALESQLKRTEKKDGN